MASADRPLLGLDDFRPEGKLYMLILRSCRSVGKWTGDDMERDVRRVDVLSTWSLADERRTA